jgi:uncharacterized protein
VKPGRGSAGNVVRVDVPLRVFYPGYYPTLTRLYRALAVPSEPVSYASSFHGPLVPGQPARGLYFRYRNLRWRGQFHSMLAPQDLLLGAAALQVLAGVLRFQRQAVPALRRGDLAGTRIGDWVAAQGYPQAFVHGFLLPAISTVCTCSYAQAAQFPAAVVVDYLARGVVRQSVHRALHGADDVQRRLLAGVADLRCSAGIAAVRRVDGGVQVQHADGSTERFDHLVLATQANQALRLLADASADESAALAGFQYTPVQVLTHTDPSLMPRRRQDWSPVNLWVDPAAEGAESTIWVNAVQPVLQGAADVFQTVGPLRPVDPARVLGQARFERPVVDARSQQALAQLQQLQAEPDRRVWFCGSYAQAGIPLLESAVGSAFDVAARLGVVLDGPVLLDQPPARPVGAAVGGELGRLAGRVADNRA